MEQRSHRVRAVLSALVVLSACAACFVAGLSFADAFKEPPVVVLPLDGSNLRAMSFNVRVNTAADGENAWPHRRDLVAATIRFHQTDIAGLQECYHDMAQDLNERLPGYKWTGQGSNGGQDGAMNPVFWRDSRLELLSEETIWLSDTPDVISTGWDASTTRVATHVVLRERRTETELHVFSTHFDHRGQQAKVQSALLLANLVSALPADAHVILLGDLNSTPDSEALKTLTQRGGLQDSMMTSLSGHHGPIGTFKGFEANRYSGRRVDYVLVRNLVVQQHAVLPDHYDGRQPSDHYPVLAEIVIE
jgi:endonuclease/exonuclease/phosphatase family metal-dependent hydrolase